MVITLVMTKSDGSSAEFPLNRQRTVIGRTNTCDLRIPVGSVSREHCEIVLVDGGAVVRDLGSSNGTYHNDIRVQEANLEAGDELTVGPVRFSVRINGEAGRSEQEQTSKTSAAAAAAPAAAADEPETAVEDVQPEHELEPEPKQEPEPQVTAKPQQAEAPAAADDVEDNNDADLLSLDEDLGGDGEDQQAPAETPVEQTKPVSDEQSRKATQDMDDPIAALEALADMDDEMSLLDEDKS